MTIHDIEIMVKTCSVHVAGVGKMCMVWVGEVCMLGAAKCAWRQGPKKILKFLPKKFDLKKQICIMGNVKLILKPMIKTSKYRHRLYRELKLLRVQQSGLYRMDL